MQDEIRLEGDEQGVCRVFLSIVVWNIETKQAICRSTASSYGHCLTVEYFNTDDNIFASAGRWVVNVSSFCDDIYEMSSSSSSLIGSANYFCQRNSANLGVGSC